MCFLHITKFQSLKNTILHNKTEYVNYTSNITVQTITVLQTLRWVNNINEIRRKDGECLLGESSVRAVAQNFSLVHCLQFLSVVSTDTEPRAGSSACSVV